MMVLELSRLDISIHAPRGGSDGAAIADAQQRCISIHAPRGGSNCFRCQAYFLLHISIHAPRGGSNHVLQPGSAVLLDFNPRSPWGEQPWSRLGKPCMAQIFQSTLPVGGATEHRHCCENAVMYFNPRSPWGEQLPALGHISDALDFNPRSPWGEQRFIRLSHSATITFQSTLPVGGATPGRITHPCASRFQSTLPVGGATGTNPGWLAGWGISIHAPRGGSNRGAGLESLAWRRYFNPRSPWGEQRNTDTVVKTL